MGSFARFFLIESTHKSQPLYFISCTSSGQSLLYFLYQLLPCPRHANSILTAKQRKNCLRCRQQQSQTLVYVWKILKYRSPMDYTERIFIRMNKKSSHFSGPIIISRPKFGVHEPNLYWAKHDLHSIVHAKCSYCTKIH